MAYEAQSLQYLSELGTGTVLLYLRQLKLAFGDPSGLQQHLSQGLTHFSPFFELRYFNRSRTANSNSSFFSELVFRNSR